MALAPGTRLGVYEILTQIGVGGMGEVYQARDTRLKRDVALKVLPDTFAQDTDRLARFQREAELLATLNHPNIAGIYGLEESNGIRALVLELVEGPTLADRIAKGPIPLDEALPIALQIAEALEAAHEKGVIHRDLKPANVKITPDGSVKVLDFGLAKLADAPAASGAGVGLSQSPTITSPAMTQLGVILGTAAYMSPEQARGKPVDKRADIWAFGCVLYEMLTGRRLIDGQTTSDTIAAILKEEPEWALVPPEAQPLLRACLQKDAARRLRDIGDVRVLIDGSVVGTTPSGPAGGTRRWVAGSVLAVAIAAMATIATAFYLRRPSTDAQVIRFEIPTTAPEVTALAISPDGTRLAYIAAENNSPAIWSRSLNGLTPQRLEGTENATQIFWSADSRALGFFADGKLKRIDIGGTTASLADVSGDGLSGAWNKNGVILFSSAEGVSVKIFRVSTLGGEPVPLQQQDTRPGEQPLAVQGPFLPDGIHFLAVGFAFQPRPEAVLNIGTLGSSTIKRVMSLGPASTTSLPLIGYAPPGDLLFTRSGTLMAQAFDVKRLELVGDPVPIAERVGLFSVSQNGILVFRTAPNLPAGTSELVWLDRGGQRVGQIGSASTYNNPRLSRDGRRVAYDSTPSEGVASANSNIWIMDTSQGVPVRLTFNPRSDIVPSWSPDGTRIAFGSAGDPQGGISYSVFRRAASGAGADEPLFSASPNELGVPQDWSSDGRYIVFMRTPAGSTNVAVNYWVLPLDGDRKPFPLVLSKSRNIQPRVSPDSKWIAFATNESGPYQIVVQPFPDSSKGKWQITSRGGVEPTWRADGRELYYIALDGKVMAVPIRTTDSSFDAGAPAALFPSPIDVPRVPTAFLYDVAGDGQRFLFNVPVSSRNASPAPTPMTVVQNWQEELKQRVPTK